MRKFLYLFLVISLIGCKNSKIDINLNILVGDKIQNSKLPDDLTELLLPFEPKKDSIFIAQGLLFNNSSSVSYIKEKNTLDKIRGNITKQTSLLSLKEKIKNHLEGLDLSVFNNTPSITTQYFDSLLPTYDYILGLNSKIETFKINNYYSFTSINEIKSFISDSITARNINSKILLVYNYKIDVSPPPPPRDTLKPTISSFTAQPTSITIGSSTTLNWSTQNATGVSISGLGDFAANSSTQVSPSQTTTYTLTAKGQNSETITADVTITVNPKDPGTDCNKQVSAGSAQDLFSKVASSSIPDCQKNSLMKSWSKYFTSDATVTYVHNDCSANLAPMSIENFLYAIKGKNKTPYIQSDCNNKKVGGKYQSLSVQ